MEFEEALQRVGDFGRFQGLNYALLLLPVVHTAIYMMTHIFAARDLPHRCYVPECDSLTATPQLDPPWLQWAVPPSPVRRPWPSSHRPPDSCLRYVPQSAVTTLPPRVPTAKPLSSCWPETFVTTSTMKCDRWVFPEHDRTVMSEFNITCEENRWMLTTIGSLNFLGQLLGMPFSGVFSDRFGRRGLLLIAVPLSWACGMLRSFAPSYKTFLILEMLDAFCASGIYSACFILGVELVGARHRVVGSSLVASFYSLGCAFLGAAAWWRPDWRAFTRIAYVPAGLSILGVWLLPESVRWLLSRHRVDEAQAVLRRVAAINRVPLSGPLSLLDPHAPARALARASLKAATANGDAAAAAPADARGQSASASPQGRASTVATALAGWPVLQVCRSGLLVRRLVITTALWVVNSFVYFGLALRSVALAGDLHLNFVLAALVEVPSYLLAWVVSERWGRRVAVSSALGLSGAALVVFLVLPSGALQLGLFLTAKLAITASFTVLFVFTAELFPTNARHSMIGVCSTVGRIGSAIAPQTPLLEVFFWGMPILLFGLLCLGGGLLALLLPETLNKALPDTVSQAKAVGRVFAPPSGQLKPPVAPERPELDRPCHVEV